MNTMLPENIKLETLTDFMKSSNVKIHMNGKVFTPIINDMNTIIGYVETDQSCGGATTEQYYTQYSNGGFSNTIDDSKETPSGSDIVRYTSIIHSFTDILSHKKIKLGDKVKISDHTFIAINDSNTTTIAILEHYHSSCLYGDIYGAICDFEYKLKLNIDRKLRNRINVVIPTKGTLRYDHFFKYREDMSDRDRFIFKDDNGVPKFWWILHDSKDYVSFIDTKGYYNFGGKSLLSGLLSYELALRPVVKINKI